MSRQFLVTGGCGFIGSNFVSRLLQRGEKVTIFDNLTRPGSKTNLEWLRKTYGNSAFELLVGDVRNAESICKAAQKADVSFTWQPRWL